jgi:hypothetical protein
MRSRAAFRSAWVSIVQHFPGRRGGGGEFGKSAYVMCSRRFVKDRRGYPASSTASSCAKRERLAAYLDGQSFASRDATSDWQASTSLKGSSGVNRQHGIGMPTVLMRAGVEPAQHIVFRTVVPVDRRPDAREARQPVASICPPSSTRRRRVPSRTLRRQCEIPARSAISPASVCNIFAASASSVARLNQMQDRGRRACHRGFVSRIWSTR